MSLKKWTAGFALALTIVAAWILVVHFVVPQRFKIDPTIGTSRILRVQRDSLSRTDSPSIVFLGTSRVAFGIDPSVIETRLSLPPRSVVNAGYPSVYGETLERLVDQNFAYLQKAKTV